MEPKQCPFCESKDSQEYALRDKNRKVQVWCGKCGAEGPLADSMDEATAAWNNRTGDSSGRREEIEACVAALHNILNGAIVLDTPKLVLRIEEMIRDLKDTPCST